MKKVMQIFLFFVIIVNAVSSMFITIGSVLTNKYLNEYENLKSLKNKKLYMVEDFLFIERVRKDTFTNNELGVYVLEGTLISNNSRIRLTVNQERFLVKDLDKQPLYQSKLTGDYFLKDAPKAYYSSLTRSFYYNIYLKISFYIFFGFIIYLIIKYRNNLKYRI